MKSSVAIGLLLLSVNAHTASAGCDSTDPSFVCGLTNAEDLVRLAGTKWIVATHFDWMASDSEAYFGRFGPLEAIESDTRAVHRLYPTAESTADWDRKLYPDCPAPPKSLGSHGLNVLTLGSNTFRLYVANHGERESVDRKLIGRSCRDRQAEIDSSFVKVRFDASKRQCESQRA